MTRSGPAASTTESASSPAEQQRAPSPKPAASAGRAPAANSGTTPGATASPPPSGQRGKQIGLIAALLLAGAAGWYGYGWFTEGRFMVSTDDAYVQAESTVLTSKVSGFVVAVPVVANQRVAAGDIIASVDPGDYRLALDAARTRQATQQATLERLDRQAEAQVALVQQADAQLTAARAEAVRTAADFTRYQSLAQRDVASAQRFEQARADRDRATATVDAAQAARTAALANRDVIAAQRLEAEAMLRELAVASARAERDLSFTEIRAPFAGTIGNKSVQIGQWVQPGARLAAVVPLDAIYVDANLKETQLARVQPGQRATLTVDAFARERITGTVDSISPASGAVFSLLPPENATGNFTKIVQRLPVRIRIPADVAASGRLRPGMSVVVDIDTRINR